MSHEVIENASTEERTWTQDGLTFRELCRQEYMTNHCVFSSGVVIGHAIDTVYLKWEKDGDPGRLLLLTADELAAIAWVALGTCWSELCERRSDGDEEGED